MIGLDGFERRVGVERHPHAEPERRASVRSTRSCRRSRRARCSRPRRLGEVLEIPPRVGHHEMAVEEQRGVAPQRGHHRGSDGEVGHEVPVHDVDVEPVRRRRHLPHLFGQRPEVGGEDRGGDPQSARAPRVTRGRPLSGDRSLSRDGPLTGNGPSTGCAGTRRSRAHVRLTLRGVARGIARRTRVKSSGLSRVRYGVRSVPITHSTTSPVDDELVTVDLHAHDLLTRAELVEQVGIDLGRQDEAPAVGGRVIFQGVDEGSLVGHLLGQQVRRVPVVRGYLERQLPSRTEGRPHAGQQVEVIVHPLQRGVGEDEVEPAPEPRCDVAPGKDRPATSPWSAWARASIDATSRYPPSRRPACDCAAQRSGCRYRSPGRRPGPGARARTAPADRRRAAVVRHGIARTAQGSTPQSESRHRPMSSRCRDALQPTA